MQGAQRLTPADPSKRSPHGPQQRGYACVNSLGDRDGALGREPVDRMGRFAVTPRRGRWRGVQVGKTLSEQPRPPVAARADFEPEMPGTKRRMLIIVNPYASTVSDRLRHLVVYALQGRFEVDAVDTEARGHATELCREAAQEGY